MKLIDLKLKGFIGLKKGMGLDEISLPLGDLSGLVAFDGPNGRGKTTILENMQPFRTFASRRGTLKKHCFAKDSQKELTFEYDGDIYRTLIKMDAHTTRPDEGFIWVNDKPVVDGKVTSYDEMIKTIFGSSNLFFWSIFCAQNSKKLTDLTTGKMKELFTEFLRLDRYAVYEDTVKQALGMVAGFGQAAASTALRIDEDLQQLKGIRPAEIIHDEGDRLEKNQAIFEENEKNIALLQKGVEDAKAEIAANNEKAKQRKALSLDLVAAKHELTDLSEEKGDKLTALAEKQMHIDTEIKRIKRILGGAQAIKIAADRCFVIDTQSKALTGELDIAYKARENLQKERENLNHHVAEKERILTECLNSPLVLKAEENLAALRQRLIDVQETTIERDPDYTVMQAEIKGLESRSSALDKKDADCISEKCGLIIDAIQAAKDLKERLLVVSEYEKGWHLGHQESIDEIQVKLSDGISQVAALKDKSGEEIKESKINLSGAKAKVQIIDDDLEPINKSIGVKLAQRKTLAVEFGDLTDLAKQAPDLEIATARLITQEQNEDAIKSDLAALEKEYGAKFIAGKEKIDKVADRMATIHVNEKAEKAWSDLVLELKNAGQDQEHVSKWIRDSEIKIMDAQKMQEKIGAMHKDLEKALADQNVVSTEQLDWNYLKDACGKKGLQALEIDGVSPVIEQYANELLISTFGPMNTIKFQTQDEDMKEVLNIIVMDPDGTETMLENKSGGETVWILKALRLALTLLSKEKSGRNFQTVLMDEEDGALSPANAVKFISLYRSMMDLGGFDDCYYISHKHEAVGLANHRLVFGETGVEID